MFVISSPPNVLAGVQGNYTIFSWYSTSFIVPSGWTGDRVLLNFGAVDYEATVFVNGQNVTFHRGGYFAFYVDVTSYLNSNGTNELYALHVNSRGMTLTVAAWSLRTTQLT